MQYTIHTETQKKRTITETHTHTQCYFSPSTWTLGVRTRKYDSSCERLSLTIKAANKATNRVPEPGDTKINTGATSC